MGVMENKDRDLGLSKHGVHLRQGGHGITTVQPYIRNLGLRYHGHCPPLRGRNVPDEYVHSTLLHACERQVSHRYRRVRVTIIFRAPALVAHIHDVRLGQTDSLGPQLKVGRVGHLDLGSHTCNGHLIHLHHNHVCDVPLTPGSDHRAPIHRFQGDHKQQQMFSGDLRTSCPNLGLRIRPILGPKDHTFAVESKVTLPRANNGPRSNNDTDLDACLTGILKTYLR